MPLPAMPLEPATDVVAQVALQVAMGEPGRATIDLADGEAPEETGEELLLDLVGRRAARDGGAQEGGGEPQYGAHHRPGPRRLTRKGNTLLESVSVPSKSKAATVGRSGRGLPVVSSVERSATPARSL